MKLKQGTPKSLYSACANAFIELKESDPKNELIAVKLIESHVKDFLAQKFIILMNNKDEAVRDATETLWKAITQKD